MEYMRLEKDKIYKIVSSHPSVVARYPRNYLIVCPMEEYSGRIFNFQTHFTVCFDGEIQLGVFAGLYVGFDEFVELTQNDLKEVKKAIELLGGSYCYNRKLNKLIKNENNK